jgi:alkylation response protein AidB-like acyl-CoA dehydrogenase
VAAQEPDSQANDLAAMLRDSVAAFVAGESPLDRARKWRGSQPGFDRAIWKRLAEQGWTGVMIPEALGGTGLGLHAACVIAEQLARVLAPEPYVATAVLARGLVLGGENEMLKRDLLPRLASGDWIATLADQEDVTWNDDTLPAARAVAAGDHVSITGTKRFVAPVSGVDGWIVAAAQEDALALYWVPAGTAGVTVAHERLADGTDGGSLLLQDVTIPASYRIAHGANAVHARSRALDDAQVVLAAELLGIMDSTLDMTLAYLRTRVQFGKPIGSFQSLQHRAVDLHIQRELTRLSLQDIAREFDQGADATTRSRLASRIKSRAAEAACLVTREAIKLHGAIGFADEYDVGMYFQRALVSSATLGNAATHRRRYSASIRHDVEAPVGQAPEMPESAPDTDWNAMSDDAFRAEVRGYFEAHYPDSLRYLNRRAHWSETRDWALVMSRKRWIAPAWPREHGGMGLDPGKLIIWMEEQERWGVARAPDQGILMLGPLLLRYGTPAQRERYLPKIISCENVWCQGYSEPNAGSDLASLKTEAVLDGDEWVINGSKIWTTLAQDASHMFLLARTDKTVKRQDGISFFLLDLATPGVRVRPIRNIEGNEEFCEVFFDDVRIPRENLVGEVNQGWAIAKTLLGFERLNHGSPRRAQYPLRKIEETAKRLGLWDDAEFQSKYVRLRLDVEDLASAYGHYADIVRSGRNPGPDISFLKVWATETFQRLCELLIEIAGNAGGLRGKPDVAGEPLDVLNPYYGVFTATIAAGSNEIQRNILALRVLELPR